MTSGNSFVLIKTDILSSMVFVAGQLHHNRSCIPLLCSNMSHVSEEHSPGGFLEGTDMTTLDSIKKCVGLSCQHWTVMPWIVSVSYIPPLATWGIYVPAFGTMQWMLALTERRNPELDFSTTGGIDDGLTLVTLVSIKVLLSKLGRVELWLFPVINNRTCVTLFVAQLLLMGETKNCSPGERVQMMLVWWTSHSGKTFSSLWCFFFFFFKWCCCGVRLNFELQVLHFILKIMEKVKEIRKMFKECFKLQVEVSGRGLIKNYGEKTQQQLHSLCRNASNLNKSIEMVIHFFNYFNRCGENSKIRR